LQGVGQVAGVQVRGDSMLKCWIFLTIGGNHTAGEPICGANFRGGRMDYSARARIARQGEARTIGTTSTMKLVGAITVVSSAKASFG
jgi:hypothetical protein